MNSQLTNMQTLASLPSSVPRQQLLFEYDYQGRRIQKMAARWSGPPLNMSVLRSWKLFIYDGWNLIAEREVIPTPASLRTYTWGLDLGGSMQSAGGIGGLLLVTNHGSPVTNSFVAYDGNGNVTALLDASTGSNTAQYAYGPFGELVRSSGPVANLNPFRFSTHYSDQETGMIYARNRYLEPNAGRWLNRDMAEEDAGINLYCYVNNDPLSYVDPYGLAARECQGCTADQLAKILEARIFSLESGAHASSALHDYFSPEEAARQWGLHGWKMSIYRTWHTKTGRVLFKTILGYTETIKYCCDCECTGKHQDVSAYSFTGLFYNPREIHFCPSFFDDTLQDRCFSYFHEMSHIFVDTDDLNLAGTASEIPRFPDDAYWVQRFGAGGYRRGINEFWKVVTLLVRW